MDKKGNRNLQSSSRGLATDSKKNQDVVSGKQWPRGGRRRESAGSSLTAKNEPARKTQPQRAKTTDKRPKPRGFYHGNGPMDRNEASKLEYDQDVELGSVFSPGSKKQSLNHLLFVYDTPRSNYGSYKKNNKSVANLMGTKKHKYNKEHFLQANCQFIVKDSGDYRQYFNNPDALVEWNLIEQVNVQVSEFPACPICLYPPVAGKMTRCGHIYCWPCILHYLALSDKTSRNCPICYEKVHKSELKSVVAVPHQTFNVTETITFKLMKRPRGSLVAYPADASLDENNVIFNMSEHSANDVYSKLLMANNNDIMSIIEREDKQLREQLIEDDNSSEKCFIEEAQTLLKQRENKVFEELSNNAEQENCNVQEKETIVEDLKVFESDVGQSVIDNENKLGCCSKQQQFKFHYFYQASDGQHLYLHAINAKMLEHTYGSLEFGPKTITGKIKEKEGGSMTEDLRNRLRYLQHLPLTCQFEVAEIELKYPTVSKETLEQFHDQIEKRQKYRQRRAKDEKKREKRIVEEENRKMGKYPTPNIHIESHQQFPMCGFEPRLRSESEGTHQSESDSHISDLSLTENISFENSYSGPSFATMLSTEKKRSPVWPGLKTPTTQSSPPKLINATGAQMQMQSPPNRRNSNSDVELDGLEPVPALNRNFGDAIAQALQKAEIKEDASGFGTKKKKKNKERVLFSTITAISGN